MRFPCPKSVARRKAVGVAPKSPVRRVLRGTEQGCRADCSGQSASPSKRLGLDSSPEETSTSGFNRRQSIRGSNSVGPIVPVRRRSPPESSIAVHRQRRTAIENGGTAVEMIEHVMAALAGLRIDNCIVELDGPEPPGLDGSSLHFVELLQAAGIVEQQATRPVFVLPETVFVAEPADESELTYSAIDRNRFVDYLSSRLRSALADPIPKNLG